jgi:hypothetical protein
MLSYIAGNTGFSKPNPAKDRESKFNDDKISFCSYLNFWWFNKNIKPTVQGNTLKPMESVALAYPGTDFHSEEFTLLNKEANSLKAKYINPRDVSDTLAKDG